MTDPIQLFPKKDPDAYGQAALMLVESLIHGLIEKGVLNSKDAFDIVDLARDVKFELAANLGESASTLNHSIALLDKMTRSLRSEL